LLYSWTNHLLCAGECALWLWAIADCALRRASAFPVADKLTKPAWLAILVLGGVLGYLTSGAILAQVFESPPFSSPANPLSIIALIATVAAAVYLADVRPTLREITGGR
jgi:hypothetical protein